MVEVRLTENWPVVDTTGKIRRQPRDNDTLLMLWASLSLKILGFIVFSPVYEQSIFDSPNDTVMRSKLPVAKT
jgi:hypothetical protein